jgi:hypothetical protein
MAKKILDTENNIIFESIKDAIYFYEFDKYKKPYRKIQNKIKLGEISYL